MSPERNVTSETTRIPIVGHSAEIAQRSLTMLLPELLNRNSRIGRLLMQEDDCGLQTDMWDSLDLQSFTATVHKIMMQRTGVYPESVEFLPIQGQDSQYRVTIENVNDDIVAQLRNVLADADCVLF